VFLIPPVQADKGGIVRRRWCSGSSGWFNHTL
jgi:hypothetical protein